MEQACFFCQIRNFEKLLNKHISDPAAQNQVLKKLIRSLCPEDIEGSSPEFATKVHGILNEFLGTDPYAGQKRRYNTLLMNHYEHFRERVRNSGDPLETAIRMAIAGNIIDFVPGHDIDIDHTIEQVLCATPDTDDTPRLRKEIRKSKKLLFIGDNAGEIVMDKLLIETMEHPEVVYAVRGKPVINDATMEDADMTGMHEVARVITNGNGDPSTLLSRVNEDFLRAYRNADLIISKGQGNLEGLLNEPDNIYFLLMIKCEVIARILSIPKGTPLVLHNPAHSKKAGR